MKNRDLRKNFYGIVCEAVPLLSVKYIADALINDTYLRKIVSERGQLVGYLDQGAEVRPAGFVGMIRPVEFVAGDGFFADALARNGVHGCFEITSPKLVFCRALNRRPVSGAVIRQHQEKVIWYLCPFLNVRNGFLEKSQVALVDESIIVHARFP